MKSRSSSKRPIQEEAQGQPTEKRTCSHPVAPSCEEVECPNNQDDYYKKTFKEIDIIGQGYYGKVFQVQHLHDKKTYAIKVLKPMSQDSCERAKKECERLGKLSPHPNIVNYQTSWVQESPADEPPDSGGLTIVTNAMLGLMETGMSAEEGTQSKPNLTGGTHHNSNRETGIIDLHEGPTTHEPIQETNPFGMQYVLYIQMSLCHITLHNFLNNRDELLHDKAVNVKDKSTLIKWIKGSWSLPLFSRINKDLTNNLLEGIVRGLKHIHSNNICHGDLHASNILIDINTTGKITPKISDFGIAKSLNMVTSQDSTNPSVDNFYENESELNTDVASLCSKSKDDMQRLGEIMLNLYYPFHNSKDVPTKIIKICSQDFSDEWPIQANWIKMLLSKNFEERPTATTILREGRNKQIFRFKNIDDAEIEDLLRKEEDYERLKKENQELRRKLENMSKDM